MNWRAARRRLLILAAMGGAALLLFFHSPHEKGSYPPCPFNFATGLHCPGCGSLRGTYALIHDHDLAQAFAYNPLAVVMLPLIVAWLVWGVVVDLRSKGRPRGVRPWVLYTLLGVIVTYWVVRNIPVEPFTYLAPHKLEAAAPEDS